MTFGSNFGCVGKCVSSDNCFRGVEGIDGVIGTVVAVELVGVGEHAVFIGRDLVFERNHGHVGRDYVESVSFSGIKTCSVDICNVGGEIVGFVGGEGGLW